MMNYYKSKFTGKQVDDGIDKANSAYQKPQNGIPPKDLSEDVQSSLSKAEEAYQKPQTGIPASDLSEDVQSSLSKAEEAYQKPQTGIPASDLNEDAQSSLSKAEEAYQKPQTGIPASDLNEDVQSSLSKAEEAYQKPQTGIPASDLNEDVQSSLGKAEEAYQKPQTGIPASDLNEDVQSSLDKANTALQTETDPTVPSWAKQSSKPSYTAQEVGALPNSTKYGSTIDLTMDSATYVLTLSLKDQGGTVLNTKTVDLPIESVVVNGRYDAANKKIVLTLQSGSTIDVPVGDLIAGLQTEITSVNMLDADLVDDTNSTHKFVTAQEKTAWNNKSDFSGSYNDLFDKPTIPVVPNNVSAFNNDAGYLTQHQDISGKEDRTAIAAISTASGVLNTEVGKYYRLDVAVETLTVTLPAITDLTTVRTVVIYLTGGTTPSITISTADSKDVYFQDGFEIEANSTYEINCLFNGVAWIVAAVKINVE